MFWSLLKAVTALGRWKKLRIQIWRWALFFLGFSFFNHLGKGLTDKFRIWFCFSLVINCGKTAQLQLCGHLSCADVSQLLGAAKTTKISNAKYLFPFIPLWRQLLLHLISGTLPFRCCLWLLRMLMFGIVRKRRWLWDGGCSWEDWRLVFVLDCASKHREISSVRHSSVCTFLPAHSLLAGV